MIQLWSDDNSALVLARAILRREPRVELRIFLKKNRPEGTLSVSDFWKKAVEQGGLKYKMFGIAIDRANDEENLFLQNTCKNMFPVRYELLSSIVNRGLSDTVEFRRIARKYMRPARNAHCTGVLFLSGILADEKTRNILAKTMGTQMKPVFITDFLSEEFFVPAQKQRIEILTDQNIDRVHSEAEMFLHMKLKKEAILSRPVSND